MAHRRGQASSLAQNERRQREDESRRLTDEVSELSSLKIVIEEWRADQHISGARYTKHIVVAHAPARFEVPCGEPRCQEGGHDITYDLMRALRGGAVTIEGESNCHGAVGDRPCDRVVKFVAAAVYSPSAQ